MSGEFGRFEYKGHIANVIYQIGEDCTGESGSDRPGYPSTVAFGEWLQRYVHTLAGNVAYNEVGDSAPSVSDLLNIDAAIKGLQAYRAAYLADCEDKPALPDATEHFGERLRAALEDLPDDMKGDPDHANPVAWVKRARDESSQPEGESGRDVNGTDVFAAVEQFKREHPECEQTQNIIQIARAAMDVYRRYLDAMRPRYAIGIGHNTRNVLISVPMTLCVQCGRHFPSGQAHICSGTR